MKFGKFKESEGQKIVRFINENIDAIKNYFKDRKWTVNDFEHTEWTKHNDYDWYYIG